VNAAVGRIHRLHRRALDEGVPLNAMTKHMLGLFHGQPGARQFRRHLSENATRKGAGLSVLHDALAFLNPCDGSA
jgi:tRNA-dihydrouridine synthase A